MWRQREAHLSERRFDRRTRAPRAAGGPGCSAPDDLEATMTRQADFKRRVRTRMAKTGEAYAAARAHLVGSQRSRTLTQPVSDAALRDGEHTILHVTNGDSAAGTLPEANPTRRVLP